MDIFGGKMKPDEVKIIQAALKFRLPWGKHKGTDLDHVPSGYFRWLSESCDDDHIATQSSIVWQWRKRIEGHWFD